MSYGHVQESCGCSWLPHRLPIRGLEDYATSEVCKRHATSPPQILASILGAVQPNAVPASPEPVEADFAEMARCFHAAYKALVEAERPEFPIDLDTQAIVWVTDQARYRAQGRAAEYPFPALGGAVVPEPTPAQKFEKALLDGATDEEIVALARLARDAAKSIDEGEKWKRGE